MGPRAHGEQTLAAAVARLSQGLGTVCEPSARRSFEAPGAGPPRLQGYVE